MSELSQPSGIEAEVCSDIARRQQLGIAKYGQTVAQNPAELRVWLQHAYEENIDAAIYLKRAIRAVESGDLFSIAFHPDATPEQRVFIPASFRCRRCEQVVDLAACRCGCTTGPSPWERINANLGDRIAEEQP